MISARSAASLAFASAALTVVAWPVGRGERADRASRHLRRSRRDLQPRRTPSRPSGSPAAQVTVDVTRGGRDAGQLTIATGEIRGCADAARRSTRPTASSIPALRYRTRTQLRVDDDGTFDDRQLGRGWRDWFERDRVEIRDSGTGTRRARRPGRRRAEGPAHRRPLGRRRRDRDATSTATSASASPRRR